MPLYVYACSVCEERRDEYRSVAMRDVAPTCHRQMMRRIITAPAMVMGDIKPYRSMIDGRMITSRSQHRDHLKQHNCVEVGNDSSLTAPPKPRESAPGLKQDIIDALNKVTRS